MKRIYHPYWNWEDYQAGLYIPEGSFTEKQEEHLAKGARDLLSNPILFEEAALKVIEEWVHAADVNLSNPSRNRQAWIGQASCCYALKIPEYITKFGWRLMSPEQQTEANLVADKVIRKWEIKNKCRRNTSLTTFLKPAEKE